MTAGPLLYFRRHQPGAMELAAVVVRPGGARPGDIATELGRAEPRLVHQRCGHDVWGYSFAVPTRGDAWYGLEGTRYPVSAALDGDLRLAYVSCNGQEHGDLDRPSAARNAMWRRLGEQHAAQPFQLLLQGGDQIYADEATQAHPLTRDWPKVPATVPEPARGDLDRALRDAFFERYVQQSAQEEFAWVAARVPSLAMWDDHDICDGWGSLPADVLDSAAGRSLFAAARDYFLLFQLGTEPSRVPDICLDSTGQSLTWTVALPGLTLVAPDLRSERRPERVMGELGWNLLHEALEGAGAGRLLLLSSVPALGPRLSLVERLMHVTPRMEKYEDDLRDQWQSRAHRREWQALLRALLAIHESADRRVTVLSGEIHLATRGTLGTKSGPLHQLVASGISHPPPPRAYARGLGALASLGETPLPGHPIRLYPLPGIRQIYTRERNYLLIERRGGDWSACWELEERGATPPLAL